MAVQRHISLLSLSPILLSFISAHDFNQNKLKPCKRKSVEDFFMSYFCNFIVTKHWYLLFIESIFWMEIMCWTLLFELLNLIFFQYILSTDTFNLYQAHTSKCFNLFFINLMTLILWINGNELELMSVIT
jgi:hypothetical protein